MRRGGREEGNGEKDNKRGKEEGKRGKLVKKCFG